ncbi:hypothetical protein WS0625 [Wolinella succinogenes]|uniref:Uncharacterized protein n=1 Tax=Wolinella succinogenes (strain ATCC 29543 / DSM 1740 / CCUG 13145 / JCM 31913 / LMG 7466 / NCTC 11488 / FDC 602W) TaxID=273121 RepID=Q7MSA7_WOLSU|nr:hypothetical protein WS0625 [Wolinella succinogenes]
MRRGENLIDGKTPVYFKEEGKGIIRPCKHHPRI